jgi:hypothetical protein
VNYIGTYFVKEKQFSFLEMTEVAEVYLEEQKQVLQTHQNDILPGYSWVSLRYFAVNLTGGQPKMY